MLWKKYSYPSGRKDEICSVSGQHKLFFKLKCLYETYDKQRKSQEK